METPTSTTAEMEKVEGENLLGQPAFTELENGRFRCVETGHEVLAKDMYSYSSSKRCRLGLIDFALSHRKSPLNMFEQDPLSRSKLKCKLTGDTINKTEEHIWKHINGKRFLNKLEQKELEKDPSNKQGDQQGKKKAAESLNPSTEKLNNKKKVKGLDQTVSEPTTKTLKPKTEKSNNKKKVKGQDQTASEPREPSSVESDSEESFWMPPAGQRWDCDDGGDRWGSGSDSEHEIEKANSMEDGDENGGIESDELSKRTKRMSIEIGPSSFATRKKKSKKSST